MVLAGYEVVRKVFDGVSAELFLAEAARSRERLIVEILRPELLDDCATRERLRDEAKLRRRLRHPNVVRRIAATRTQDGRRCFVTEPVGERLADALRSRGPLSLAELIRLALPLCDALHCYHQRGLTHGNVKPASVFVRRTPTGLSPKLVDFGFALFRSGRPTPMPGAALVEPEYLAPERVAGHRATPSGDVYGLGVLLYEAATGHPPFTGEDSHLVRRRQLHEPPPPLPPPLAPLTPIVHRCLAKDPTARYPSALALKQALASLLVQGEIVGNYRLERLLGEGSMGRVYLARHRALGRRVALKLLKPELAGHRDELERFFREARAVNDIDHPHIVEVHDIAAERAADGTRRVYCVMELLDGETLGELLRRGPLPLRRTLELSRQVCAALQAAHSLGVVHRDVKPDNIFVTQRGGADFVKVLDFGVAKLRRSRDRTGVAAPSASHTGAGKVVGTPTFMAPEQALAKAVDHRADIWALGVVLYLSLTGRRPFVGPTLVALLQRIVREPAPRLGERTPGGEPIPAELASLVRSCLAKNPADRPASMAEVSRALEVLLASPPRPPPRSHRRILFVISLALGAGGAALVALHRTPPRATAASAPAPLTEQGQAPRAPSDDALKE